ncbi:MAG: nucleotidyltransferase domain-containing protein [Lachnospiraceae bacterium]|nr:nucleotidyltransferase domain-containing protein [Lachnospiraceae bacterium]
MSLKYDNSGRKEVILVPTQEIEELKKQFVDQLVPSKIYLFGSFANNSYTEDSDFDFYIIVDDNIRDMVAETAKAYRAVRRVKKRPVDIIIGTKSRFEARKKIPSVENEVYRKGILLYDAGDERRV